MITTVCMNPSFDKTASVKALKPGELNRLCDVRVDVGGKGVNVAVVLKRLGVPGWLCGLPGRTRTGVFPENDSSGGCAF